MLRDRSEVEHPLKAILVVAILFLMASRRGVEALHALLHAGIQTLLPESFR